MNLLLNENIREIKNIYEVESENESINKSCNLVGINRRRKTACEREAIFNRLILNNPSIISADTTLSPGTCVYCNICQVRIILNPAYYLNNWRTHMNGKLHKALSKAVGSPQFLDELDFLVEKDDETYFELSNSMGHENTNSCNNVNFRNHSDLFNEMLTNLSTSEQLIGLNNTKLTTSNKRQKLVNTNDTPENKNVYENFDRVVEITDDKETLNCKNKPGYNKSNFANNLDLTRKELGKKCQTQIQESVSKSTLGGEPRPGLGPKGEIQHEHEFTQDNVQGGEFVIHPIVSNLEIDKGQSTREYGFIQTDCILNNMRHSQSNLESSDDSNNQLNRLLLNDGLPGLEKGGELSNEHHDKLSGSGEPQETFLFTQTSPKRVNEDLKKCSILQCEDQKDIAFMSENNECTNIKKNDFSFLEINKIPVITPILRMDYEQMGTFACPGINKVRYWAMCFIGSERSTEPNYTLSNSYSDTRRVFYKQSIITKISPNHEPEHQGVVHHPNCLEVVAKPNEPCERCSLYINNRQLARVISKRATRLQEMWDRVVAGESIINGGGIPQSIISSYNHRIDHWSRCNDPLEAITRALAGCRQRDYTNFFWKIRENLLKNSRLVRNQL
ncbi:hypothetical protein HWI79_3512 [Cryptosporidium felis]|nr:hypothetical protein HWI79_3512 [Cryptosporidium felis]